MATAAREAEMPYARKGEVATAATPIAKATLLTPIFQEGTVNISDLLDLSPAALRVELVRRANALIPLLQKNALETERNRRVVEDNIEAIRAAGLFKISIPRRHGGLEVGMRTFLDVSRELAKGCGSTAWATTLMNVCAWFVGYANEQTQADIWGDNPDARVAGVFAPSATSRKVEGGYRVTGKWGWASGSLHSSWAYVGVPIVDEAGTEVDQGFAVIPMSELTIEDTWYVVGMQGTGSNTLVAEDVFIPEHRVGSVSKMIHGETATPFKGEAMYRSAFIPVAALVLTGPQLGLCQRALDYVIEKAPSRGVSYTFYDRQADSASFQLMLAEAATTVDTAHLFAYRAAEAIDTAAAEGRPMTYLERARVKMDVGKSITSARDAIDMLISAHGAGSFAEASIMQRVWRDCETASRHAVLSPSISAEVYGKALLGIEGGVTALV